ncbi:MAG: hypothetical protein HQM06_16670 [Magnetococcales bacterium]|nr:hypothetical protein [Magnetococcales bacterium]
MANGSVVALLPAVGWGQKAGKAVAGLPSPQYGLRIMPGGFAAPSSVAGYGAPVRTAYSAPVLPSGGVGNLASPRVGIGVPPVAPVMFGRTLKNGVFIPPLPTVACGKKWLQAIKVADPQPVAVGQRLTQAIQMPLLPVGVVGRLLRNPLAVSHRSVLTIQNQTAAISASHRLQLAYQRPITASHRSVIALSATDRVVASHALCTSIALSASHTSRLHYQATPVSASHRSVVVLAATDRVTAHHRAMTFYVGPSTILQTSNTLYHTSPANGLERALAIMAAKVSIEEGSHSWTAHIELDNPDDFASVNIGDPLRLLLAGEEYRLVVDRKNHAQNSPERISPTINAISPLALRGAPFVRPITQDWSAGVDASTVVAALIGPVEWQLPHWTIPPGQLSAVNADPLAVAKQVVAAAGGVIESAPDGSVVCRPLFPVSVPAMATAAPEHCLDGDHILERAESLEMADAVNRLIVCNASVAIGAPQLALEQADHPLHPTSKQIRAYPIPWRQVTLVHTGDALVALRYIGIEERQEIEVVDFSMGKATARYPIYAILSYAWQYQDLGVPEAVTGSKSLIVPENEGQSLLRLTYVTRCHIWEADDPRNEEILFLAYD